MHRPLAALALVALLATPALLAQETEGPASWSRDPLVDVVPYRLGLNFPLGLNFLDDGRIFYGEWQTGRVMVIAPGNGALSTFVDLDVLTGGEMGLHEVDYHVVDGKPYVYVSYTYGTESVWGCNACRARLSRFEEVAPGVAGPEQVLLDLQGGYVHNGGIIAWGPLDGKLYYSRGDASFDQWSQHVNGYTGRVLRLNPDGTLPSDNPMGPTNPTYAYGLRHTYGMDFVPGTQLLLGTENGPDRNDEVNLLLPGQNYGWPLYTGYEAPAGSNYQDPVRSFVRTIGPTNGHVYTGTRTPHLTGEFFYGDTNNGDLYRLVTNGGFDVGSPRNLVERVVDSPPFLIIDVRTGADGFLYFSRPEGLYRLQSAEEDVLPGVRVPDPVALLRDLLL